jgi:superfamily II DNA or RNA helicase/transcriptional regulator with XRE-family HTH domain
MRQLPADYDSRIKDLRVALELTQSELADRLGVSFATVNRWENRQTKPNRIAWEKVVELTNELRESTTSDEEEPKHPSLDYCGNANRAKLLVESLRLSFGHAANPAFATETSLIDPLPHQRITVYDHMLQQNPLRFLLADDAGAGKTIMSGLYIREMLSRRLLRRVLIVPPAGLIGNWKRELDQLFGLRFEIVTGNDTRLVNPFTGPDSDRIIVSVDTLSAPSARRRLQDDQTEPYDLVVFDEAHKLSARLDHDGTFRATNRYRLAESLAGVHSVPDEWRLQWRAHHLLLLTATPHMGKDYPYFCLWRLLEPDGFSTPEAFVEAPSEVKQRHFIRRTKEEMVTLGGAPLYPRRISDTLSYDLSQGEVSEQELYDRTTRYIRTHYNTARIFNRSAARFAMTVFQRRLVSSPWALMRSFERRLEKLEGIIRDIRTGKITEDALVRGQLRLANEIEDPFESLTADEEAPAEGIEQNEVAESKILTGVVATSLAELVVEKNEVTALLKLAQEVDERGQDSKFERLREVLKSQENDGHKLIIFTEHRDTLDFLVRRLEGLGYAGRIAMIHGGMGFEERERQVDHFRRRAEEGGANYLVATDAAGEGINLQFCWQMVNYDIPWNPARLEQRMGRIHRYGQKHDPVVIINLVAAKTREGMVLNILLDKMEKIRQELGNEKVFDVIGRIFKGMSITDYMALAMSDDGCMEATAAIDSQMTSHAVTMLVDSDREVYGASSDVRPELSRLQKEIERETYRRLLPGYVRRFLEQAGRELGFKLEGDADEHFTLQPARAGSLDFLWPAIEHRMSSRSARLTLIPRAGNDLILVHPGEEIFDTLCERVSVQFAADGLRGSVIVDPSAEEPYFLHLGLLRTVRRASEDSSELASEEQLEARLVAFQQSASGDMTPCEPERLLLTQSRQGVPPTALPLVASSIRLKNEAATWIDEHCGPGRAEHWRSILSENVKPRTEFLKRGFDHRSAELARRRSQLRSAASSGKLTAQRSLETTRSEQRELADWRDIVMTAARLEPELVAAEPVKLVAHFLVVPSSDEQVGERFDDDVEAIAMRVATAYEEALGANVHDVSTPTKALANGLTDWPGFDLLSTRPSGFKLAIEVKGRAASGSVDVTENEWARACNHRDGYWLYVVYGCATAHPQLIRVQDPFGKLLVGPRGGVVIKQQQIMAAADKGEG